MRRRAAHEDRVQHARQRQIDDELPLPDQQPVVLAPEQRAPDIGRADVAHGSILAGITFRHIVGALDLAHPTAEPP
ncbi:MAG: hypothetical protein ACREE9_05640 [Stellaceae bacterium]